MLVGHGFKDTLFNTMGTMQRLHVNEIPDLVILAHHVIITYIPPIKH